MSLIDKHFKDALKNLPEQKLSWATDRALKKSIRQRASELDGKKPFWMAFRRFVAAPVAFALLLVSTGGYAYVSPSVVQGDLLYPVKTELENRFYPQSGTSEERVAYHLWLSERRYAEVQEILERRESGKKMASVVFAQGLTNDPLDDILVQTLQRATQHVEYAFLVTDEIKEVEKVKSVKEKIKITLETQKKVLEEVAPVLEEVKFLEKPKARQKSIKEEVVPRVIAEAMDAGDVNLEDLPVSVESSIGSRSVPVESVDEFVEEGIAKEDLPKEFLELALPPELESTMIEIEVLADIDDAADFLLDRLAFQEDLLESMDEAVEEAEILGVTEVELEVAEELEIIAEAEVKDAAVFGEALASHYEKEQEQLQEELEKLDEILIASTDDGKELQEFEELEEVDAEDLEDLNELKDLKDHKDGEDEKEEEEEVIIAAVDPVVEDDLVEEEDEENDSEKKVEEEEVVSIVAVEELPEEAEAEEELGEEVSIAAVEVEVLEDEDVVDPEPEAEKGTEEAEIAVLSVDPEATVVSGEADPVASEKTDFEVFIDKCRQAVRDLCSEYTVDGCIEKSEKFCDAVQSATEIETHLQDVRIRLDQIKAVEEASNAELGVREKMEEAKDRLQELDTRIERLEGGK
jgi:hypothetical protein